MFQHEAILITQFHTLKGNSARPYLSLPVENTTDYINAVYLDVSSVCVLF